MKSLSENHKHTLQTAVILTFAFLWNLGAYSLPKFITRSWYHYDMTLAVDDLVPFVPWTVAIYFGCYLIWAINYGSVLWELS